MLTETAGSLATLPEPASAELATDRDLLRQFLTGEQAAFSALVERHAGLVLGVCRPILRNAKDVEDAFQATFFVFARKAQALLGHASIAGWLHQTARRTALKLRSTMLRRREAPLADGECVAECDRSAADPGRQAAIAELVEILDTELSSLPDRFREVILLAQVEGLGRDEIAARLGITVAAVKDRLERGREQLKARLSRRGITLTATLLAAWLVPTGVQAAGFGSLVTATALASPGFAAGSLVAASVTSSSITTGSLSAAASPGAITLAQGTLKMMGLEKLKTISACVVSFLMAGGIALGMLQDEPTRFEKGIQGELVSVSGEQPVTVTISLDGSDTLLNLDVSDDVKIWVAFESGELGDLKEGQFLSLRLEEDHRTVGEIHVQGVIRDAKVASISPDGKITITEDDDDEEQPGTTRELELAPDVIVRIGGLPATPADLKPGLELPLEMARNGNVVNAIEVDAEDDSIIAGELLELLGNDGLVLAVESEEHEDDEAEREPDRKTYATNAETLVVLDHKAVKLNDLPKGAFILLRMSDDGKVVRAIKAESPEPDEEPEPEQEQEADEEAAEEEK